MSKFPSQEMDRFNVRLPAGMRDAIAERAKANGRSMNSEIVQILEDRLSTERELEEFIIDDAKRPGGVDSLSKNELEEMMEKTVRKVFSEFTLSPIDKIDSTKSKKPT
ncbi:TPA: Arc family DNA-binding protein [Klebsiella oxytoca]|nr:Arc family DNA-binding protein [Klebsiella oxytoca]